MSYLLDKKNKRKKLSYGVFFIVVFFILFHFRSGIFDDLAYVGNKIFYPVLLTGNRLEDKFSSIGSFFASKNSLYLENADLKSKLNQDMVTMSNYDSVLNENIQLKEILARKDPKMAMTLAAILEKPNQSPYDTLIIDAGLKQMIKAGNIVFAFGNVPIGRIETAYPDSSKVILFSSSGEKTRVVLSGNNTFLEIVGRGGGNFEMVLPRDLTLSKGDQAALPGIVPYVVGIVQTIISDPRDPSTKALLTSPVNVQGLKFVEVEK